MEQEIYGEYLPMQVDTDLLLLSFAIENTLLKHKTLQVNYPFTLTDLQQKRQDLRTLQSWAVCK